MKKQHEWLGIISTRHIMELNAIGYNILVLAQCGVQKTFWRCGSLGPLEKEDGVTYELYQQLKTCNYSPQHDQKVNQQVKFPTQPSAKTRHCRDFELDFPRVVRYI